MVLSSHCNAYVLQERRSLKLSVGDDYISGTPSGHHISQRQWRTISTIQHSRPPLHILEEHHSTTNLSPRVFANTERMDLAFESYGLQQHLRALRMAVLDE